MSLTRRQFIVSAAGAVAATAVASPELSRAIPYLVGERGPELFPQVIRGVVETRFAATFVAPVTGQYKIEASNGVVLYAHGVAGETVTVDEVVRLR